MFTVNTGLSTMLWGQPVQTPRISLLSEDEKILYNKIGNDMIRLHTGQRQKELTSENCVIIFRQSKSWMTVQDSFTLISSKNTKIINWVNEWTKRIGKMRASQEKIQELAAKIGKATTDLFKEKDKDKIKVIENAIKKSKNSIKLEQKKISNDLKEGRQSLVLKGENFKWGIHEIPGTMEAPIESSTQCQKVIQFLKDNWHYLEVFSKLQEAISLDEEKLCVELGQSESSNSYENLLKNNKSYKAIFEIKSSIAYANAESGKVTSTVEVVKPFFTEEPTSEKKHSSTLTIIKDSYLFNANFAQADEVQDKLKQTNAFAEKLERIVTMALNRLNVLLNPQDQSQINLNSLKFSDEKPNNGETEAQQAPYFFERIIHIVNNLFTQPTN